jgi:hypothetical protein
MRRVRLALVHLGCDDVTRFSSLEGHVPAIHDVISVIATSMAMTVAPPAAGQRLIRIAEQKNSSTAIARRALACGETSTNPRGRPNYHRSDHAD